MTKVPLSLVDRDKLDNSFAGMDDPKNFTRFEKFILSSVANALSTSNIPIRSKDTILIVSTTKGNIDLLESNKRSQFSEERKYIWNTADLVNDYFGFENEPIVMCNACISGVLAINTGRMLLEKGIYKHAVVVGADILSRFVISGFQSFQSLSPKPCRPFDKSRDGLSLGEGSSTMVLSTEHAFTNKKHQVSVIAGSGSNDANHISGPSRSGEGLIHDISKTLLEAGMQPEQIDFLSSHGTATDYNDEMEAKAFNWAGLNNVPVNSFKGYFGHTMGAAGVLESVLSVASMRGDMLFNSLGYDQHGVSIPLKIISGHKEIEMKHILKTASGFGGCNATLIFKKEL
mgnify:CR=1 FL=1